MNGQGFVLIFLATPVSTAVTLVAVFSACTTEHISNYGGGTVRRAAAAPALPAPRQSNDPIPSVTKFQVYWTGSVCFFSLLSYCARIYSYNNAINRAVRQYSISSRTFIEKWQFVYEGEINKNHIRNWCRANKVIRRFMFLCNRSRRHRSRVAFSLCHTQLGEYIYYEIFSFFIFMGPRMSDIRTIKGLARNLFPELEVLIVFDLPLLHYNVSIIYNNMYVPSIIYYIIDLPIL